MSSEAQTESKKSYKESLNLPQTAFAMEAKLTANEPLRLKRWQEMGLYEKIQGARAGGKGKWVLHDGPPFANGDIHMGHVINKTLKDVIVRFRTMQGHQTPYVPGWDCHGLPIEHKIQQELGPKLREMSTLQVRQLCHEYAEKYVAVQRTQFQRLGILGDWERPYLTMSPEYEAKTLEVFAEFVKKGLVYKKLKPVPWSIENQTALADAELEYQDIEDTSIFVLFELEQKSIDYLRDNTLLNPPPNERVYLMIWTTTPWTLPANLAVAVNPGFEYQLYDEGIKVGGKPVSVIVEPMCAANLNLRLGHSNRPDGYRRGICEGKQMNGLRYKHPFLNKSGSVVLADYVAKGVGAGTGLVHTAPGHGEDDYETGMREGLEVYSPVLANGRFDDSVPDWIKGKKVWEANAIIIQKLRDAELLVEEQRISHSYPHDWRSKKPIIFRATEQWFINVQTPFSAESDAAQSLRDRALSAARSQIQFVPQWGQARILGMLESRPDWCISRQRAWGLPIPVFYNDKGEALLTPQSVGAVAKCFAEKGSDAWFTDSPKELLGSDFRYPPGFAPDNLRKEKDIFDVWFESGSSWNAVLRQRQELAFPADLYLEGSDQHRGWFQLSLLPSLGVTGKPPFKQVLTHGFIVKPDGTKVSKSDKEYVTATQEIDRHGADLLRLWCCSVDYQNDVPTSPKVLQEFGDKYRKIRNTLRYLLSNLYDFQSPVDVPPNSLDAWALAQLDQLIIDVTAAYDGYQLHRAFRLLHDFCAVQISAVYGNAMKDRLYCESADAPTRRRCQTVMQRMAVALCKLLAPMIVFTADEAWEHLKQPEASVHLALLPASSGPSTSEEWNLLMELRDSALAQLDKLKKEAGMNKALDAELVYNIPDANLRRRLAAYGQDLEDVVGAGFHSFADAAGNAPTVTVVDRRKDYAACARSWKRRPDVGSDTEYPELSKRDADVMRALSQ